VEFKSASGYLHFLDSSRLLDRSGGGATTPDGERRHMGELGGI
jgi:hypothetical protein